MKMQRQTGFLEARKKRPETYPLGETALKTIPPNFNLLSALVFTESR